MQMNRSRLLSRRGFLYTGMVVIIGLAVGFGLDSVYASSATPAAATRTATVAVRHNPVDRDGFGQRQLGVDDVA